MLYNLHEQLTRIKSYYEINQERLEYIRTINYKEQFDEIRKDINTPMLVIREFLKELNAK